MEQKKVRLAIVGTGSISHIHAKAMQPLTEAELVAICDMHTEQIEKFTQEFPMAKENCYTDLDEMLQRADIDAVIICTSDTSHCDIAVRAMRAGKDVLCEKPMALDVDDCRKMV